MNELTDRIVKAMLTDKVSGSLHTYQLQLLAAAIVAELGLRDEWGALDGEFCGALYDSRTEVRVLNGEHLMHRYITEWSADE